MLRLTGFLGLGLRDFSIAINPQKLGPQKLGIANLPQALWPSTGSVSSFPDRQIFHFSLGS